MGLTNNLGKLSNMITSTGSAVGIGTSSPIGKFNVVAGTNLSLVVQDSGLADTIELSSYSSGGGLRQMLIGASNLLFYTGTAGGGSSTEKMRITTSGNVGIGESAPSCKLDIVGSSSAANTFGILTLRNSSSAGISIGASGTSYGWIQANIYGSGAANIAINANGGNVGIGTDPGTKLDVLVASNNKIQFGTGLSGSSGQYVGGFYYESNKLTIQSFLVGTDYQPLLLAPNGGNVGVATTSPGSKLEVFGAAQNSANTSNAIFKVNSNSTNALVMGTIASAPYACYIQSGGSGTYPLALNPNGGNVGIGMVNPSYQLQLSSDSAGKPNGGSWANSSDIRLKENIKTIDNAVDKITQLRGVTFDWKDETEQDNIKQSAGFIADEVMLAFPNWVRDVSASINQKELINDDKVKSLSLPFEFDALLVQAIKELNERLNKAGL
jgi:hypothetical protein